MAAKKEKTYEERRSELEQEWVALSDWFTEFIDTAVADLQDKSPGLLGDQYLVSVARQAARKADPKKWARLSELEARRVMISL